MERQTTLAEFFLIKQVYIPLTKKYTSRKGLAEKLLKKRLEKQGWEVWRAGLIGIVRRRNLYPNVLKKYQRLCYLMERSHPGCLDMLQYMAHVHHGMPDFVCHRRGSFKFVECKLGHEQLSRVQKKCLVKLQGMGFKAEVHKLAEPCTKTRLVYVDVRTGKKIVMEKQLKLKA